MPVGARHGQPFAEARRGAVAVNPLQAVIANGLRRKTHLKVRLTAKKSGTAKADAFRLFIGDEGVFCFLYAFWGNNMVLTGSQIVIQTLIEQGVTDVFGYPGGQVLDIYDELFKTSDRIKHYLFAHEQGAAHAADGYARATGKVGVVMATSGPGATNLVTGIATAMLDSIPMVAITGNVPSYLIGKDSFQEVNITGITLPITKHNYFVTDVKDLAVSLREAFSIAASGRPGSVLVDIPKDVQLACCEYTPKGVAPRFPQANATEQRIEAAAKLISAAKRPYIYIGGGAARADVGNEILRLADKIDAVIGCSLMGISVLPDSNGRFLGMQGMHGRYASTMAMKAADLIIGIGVRFSDRATGNTNSFGKSAKIIQLDADLSEINKNIKVDVGLVGDLRYSLEALCGKCDRRTNGEWQQLAARYKAAEDAMFTDSDNPLTPKRIFDTVNALRPRGTVVATDVGQHQMWAAQHLRFEERRRFLTSGGLGTMGYGMGAAIGAHIGTGEKALLITGDGSFGMNLNELATAVTYNIPLTVLIINNSALGMVRQWQTLFYEKRCFATELVRKTDFVKLAEAFGLGARRVTTEDELKEAFACAMEQNGPFLIDAVIDRDELVFPMLPPDGSAADLIIGKEVE